jgi:hypothetical protein
MSTTRSVPESAGPPRSANRSRACLGLIALGLIALSDGHEELFGKGTSGSPVPIDRGGCWLEYRTDRTVRAIEFRRGHSRKTFSILINLGRIAFLRPWKGAWRGKMSFSDDWANDRPNHPKGGSIGKLGLGSYSAFRSQLPPCGRFAMA